MSQNHSLPLASAIAAVLYGQVVTAAPGVPSIDWMETNYALVEINQSTTVYADLVTVKDNVLVPVSWNKWSGDGADWVEYRLNGEVVLTDSLTPNETQTGTADLPVSQGGRYLLTVALCNADGCSESAAKEIVVADTDGSHVQPIQLNAGENNQPYENSTDSVVGAYFVEWGVYGREFPVDKIPAYNLTHILYGFVPICGGAGINDSLAQANAQGYGALQTACSQSQDFEVVLHDPWAAIQMPQQGHDYSTPYKGNFGQLMELKAAYPNLKIIPSIGGWTLSDPFYFFDDSAKRQTFVDSVERFVRTWKFLDGVDIDWEYPGGRGANTSLGDPSKDGETYRLLMADLRAMLDRVAADTGRELILTSAVGADPSKSAVIDYGLTQHDMDLIFMMTYDFYGAWSLTELGHQTALYAPEHKPDDKFNIDSAIQALLAQGVDPAKVAVGVAMYGRGWSGVTPGPDGLFSGQATAPISGTWEAGVLDYRAIANDMSGPEWEQGYDAVAQGAYRYNASTGDLVTYDNATSVRAKGNYARSLGLAGLFAWEIDADNGDILNAMHEGLGHGGGSSNQSPVARAGSDQTVTTAALVSLDGSGSFDPNGDVLSYQWSQLSGPAVVLDTADGAVAEFYSEAVEQDQTLVFELTVSDGQASASDQVEILLRAPATNQAPSVTLPASLSVQSGESVQLSATATDPDGDSLSYTWAVPAELAYQDLGDGVIEISAPTVSADTGFNIELVVSDGELSAQTGTGLTVLAETETGQCDNTDANAATIPAWDAGSVYLGGDQVSHGELVWSANWWTQGNEPAIGSEVWTLVSDVEVPWNAATAYNGGDEVNHDGGRYRAKWWTKGEEPGTAEVWVLVGEASCD